MTLSCYSQENLGVTINKSTIELSDVEIYFVEIKPYLHPQAEVLYTNKVLCQWPKSREGPLTVFSCLSLEILVCLYLHRTVRSSE